MAIEQAVSVSTAPGRDLRCLSASTRMKDGKMHPSLRSARLVLSAPRLIPHMVIMVVAWNAWLVKADLTRWAEIFKLKKPEVLTDFVLLLVTFMTFVPEFRNVFYMRLGIKAKLFSWLCPPLESLKIEPGDIGPGLFVQHGIGTLISAESIGANCWINQGVSVGYYNETGRPRIGDNVRIAAGAKVLGHVTVGNNATVGPNTVVLDDVPPEATVLGVPGKIVWRSNA